MTSRLARLIVVLFSMAVAYVATVAIAQGSGDVILPTGAVYTVRFTVPDPRTTSVCIQAVTADGTAYSDVNGDASTDALDAIGCTQSFVADGATANVITIEISPPLARGIRVAGRAYDGNDPLDPRPSPTPDNWKILSPAALRPIVLLD